MVSSDDKKKVQDLVLNVSLKSEDSNAVSDSWRDRIFILDELASLTLENLVGENHEFKVYVLNS